MHEGKEVNVAKACANFSREKTLLPRGMGRLSRWWSSQKWIGNLDSKAQDSSLEIHPEDLVICMREKGWSLSKAIMCIRTVDDKFKREDFVSPFDNDAYILFQEMKRARGQSVFQLERSFSFKMVYQALEIFFYQVMGPGCLVHTV